MMSRTRAKNLILSAICSLLIQGISVIAAQPAAAVDGDLGSLEFGSSQTKYLEYNSDNPEFAFGTGDFTVEYRWKPTDLTRRSDVLDFWSTPGAGSAQSTRFMIGTFGGNPLVYVDSKSPLGSGSRISSPTGLSLNAWNHIAVTRAAGVMKLWINGTEKGSYSTALDFGSTGMKLSIMKDHSETRWPADGSGNLAGIRVVLGSALYSSNFTSPTTSPGFVTGTTFLLNSFQGANNFLRDSSANNLTAASSTFPASSSDTPFVASAITLAPNISSVAASTGSTLGGTSVRITGTYLGSTSQVLIGGVAGNSLVVESSTSVTVTTPSGSLGAKNVQVITPSGATTLTNGFTYVSALAPTISALSTNTGLVAGGTAVTISGTNLDTTTSVTIGGNAATIVSNSSTQLSITTPPGSDGAKDVVVSTAGGSATSIGGFTYITSFTVSYTGGAGSSGVAPTQANRAPNETFTVADGSQISKTGYTFSKWKDSSNTDYLPGSTYTVTNASVTLTAQWIIDTHQVVFNANGGSNGSTATLDYNSNALLSAPGVIRSNYSLIGWAETTTASVLSSWTVVGNKTLYAIWSPKVYTITYSPESGTATTASETFTVLTMPSTWQIPTRSNYAFDGWYTDKTWSTLRGTGGSSFTPNETETVYAKWTQSSLVGLTSPTSFGNIIATPGNDGGISATRSGTRVEVDYFADSLPDNTVITAYLQGNTTRAASVLTGVSNLLLSVVVAWKAPDETVPDVDPTKSAIRMKITNAGIKSGAKVYSIVNNASTLLATATQDGFVVIELRVDPEIVIANPVEAPLPPSGGGGVAYTPTPSVDESEKIKAVEAKAAEELKIAREKAEAEIKAAQDAADLDAKLKAEEEAQLAAKRKAEEDAALAEALVAQNFVPALTLYSISSKLKLSTFDTAYLTEYVSTLKKRATVTCIGYVYSKLTSMTKARALATSQATAVCKMIKAKRKTLVTKVQLLPASKAPKAAVGSKWVAVSYRVDGYKS